MLHSVTKHTLACCDTKVMIPDRCYADVFMVTVEFGKQYGAFDPTTLGPVAIKGWPSRSSAQKIAPRRLMAHLGHAVTTTTTVSSASSAMPRGRARRILILWS